MYILVLSIAAVSPEAI